MFCPRCAERDRSWGASRVPRVAEAVRLCKAVQQAERVASRRLGVGRKDAGAVRG
jgi:hypothetical protein